MPRLIKVKNPFAKKTKSISNNDKAILTDVLENEKNIENAALKIAKSAGKMKRLVKEFNGVVFSAQKANDKDPNNASKKYLPKLQALIKQYNKIAEERKNIINDLKNKEIDLMDYYYKSNENESFDNILNGFIKNDDPDAFSDFFKALSGN